MGSDYGYILFVSQAETEAVLRAALDHAGSLRAGDRVPNCVATVVGGQGSSTAAPVNRELFDLLSPDRFTLLTATW